jgi:ribonucleotide reductase alpha subunit
MAGVRTNVRQFASCVLVDVDDDLDAIFSSIHAVGKYTARRAGIGINIGRMRPINSPIRGGEVLHTGLIPYLKSFESTVKSTSQNGIRGGSATIYAPFWHYEIEDVLVLKNNAGTDDNRVRKLDYCIQFCRLFYDRLIKNQDITLFSPHEAVGLYDAFGDNEKFDELYVKYENSKHITMKKKVSARKLAEIYARERLETGRIYSMNLDNANEHGSWNIPVKMSNLCLSGNTKIDAIVENSKMVLTMLELNNFFSLGKEICVLSKNIHSNRVSYQKVIDSARTMENAEVLEIEDINSGYKLICTPNHKVYTKNRGYIEAQNLKEEDELETIP